MGRKTKIQKQFESVAIILLIKLLHHSQLDQLDNIAS